MTWYDLCFATTWWVVWCYILCMRWSIAWQQWHRPFLIWYDSIRWYIPSKFIRFVVCHDGVGSISGPGPRARAGMGPVRGPAWSPQSPRARASMGSPRARRAREPAEPAGSAGFNLFRPTSFKVFCRNPACSRKTTAYYNPILFHATAKYYSILVYTTTVPDHTRKFFSVLQSNTPYYNCTTP